MTGLPPIDVHDNKMLPVVYRRSDIVRSANPGGPSPPEPRDRQVALANNGIDSGAYKYSRNNSPVVVKPGNSYPKGLIVDVWA